jgi:hypothetical protein
LPRTILERLRETVRLAKMHKPAVALASYRRVKPASPRVDPGDTTASAAVGIAAKPPGSRPLSDVVDAAAVKADCACVTEAPARKYGTDYAGN